MDKRLFAFLSFSVLIFIVWVGLQAMFLPPKKPAEAPKVEEKPVAEKPAPAPEPEPDAQQAAKRAREIEEARKAAELKAPIPDKDILLGGEGYKLTVVFSERGAAVRSMTLNEHQAADRKFGKPVFKDKEKKVIQPLVLVDDGGMPERQSFRFLSGETPILWRIVGQPTPEEVLFEGTVPGKDVKVTKTFRLKPGQYHIDLELSLERTAPGKEEFIYELTGPHGLPVEGEVWRTLPYRQVVMATASTKDRRSVTRMLYDPVTIKDKTHVPPVLEAGGDALQYAGVRLQYYAALAVVSNSADQPPPTYIGKAEPEWVDNDADFRPGHATLQGHVTTRLTSRPLKLRGDQPTKHTYLLYAGPAKTMLLGYEKGVEPGLPERYGYDLHMRTLTDYTDYPSGPWQTIGWTSVLIACTNIMHVLLQFFHGLVGWYGIAIIMLTVVVRGLMFPISRRQALATKRMQALAPEVQKIKAQFANDRQALAQAQMELYRKHKINPMRGCLILILQMPVFMGLYYALNESVNLRLAPFLWFDNLAVPDMLLYWGDNALTRFLKLGPYLNVLPILAMGLMFIQTKLLAPPPADEQQAMQMKMMNYMMIFMGYMFYWVASGLCLYFIMSSLWGLLERKLLPKLTHETKPPPEAAAKTSPRRTVDSRNGDVTAEKGLFSKLGDWWGRLLEEAKKK